MSAAAPLPDVGELVPHEPPMLLLDRLQSFGDHKAVCTVQIRPDSPFLEQRGARQEVPAVIAIEYMAQSVAAYAGMSARTEGKAPRVGLLMGCRELVLGTDGFAVGDALTVEARWVWGDSDLGSFACTIVRDGQLVASGTLSVYQGPLPEGFAPEGFGS